MKSTNWKKSPVNNRESYFIYKRDFEATINKYYIQDEEHCQTNNLMKQKIIVCQQKKKRT